MLTSRAVYEGISSVLESLRSSDLDGAKKKLESIGEVRTEREKGSVLAATGLYHSMVKSKDGTMQTWDQERISRVVQSIRGSQMADELDAGYADTLLNYSKLFQAPEPASPA